MGQAICLMGKPTGEWLANEFVFGYVDVKFDGGINYVNMCLSSYNLSILQDSTPQL